MENSAKYRDRGLKKWQGLILSEHREMLDQLIAEYATEYVPPVAMDHSEIEATLQTAYCERYRVWIALNEIDLEGRYTELRGHVQGYHGGMVILDRQPVPLEAIRCVEFIDMLKFWQVAEEDIRY